MEMKVGIVGGHCGEEATADTYRYSRSGERWGMEDGGEDGWREGEWDSGKVGGVRVRVEGARDEMR